MKVKPISSVMKNYVRTSFIHTANTLDGSYSTFVFVAAVTTNNDYHTAKILLMII